MPVRITRVAPSAFTSWIAMRPIGPGPSTATVSPAKYPPAFSSPNSGLPEVITTVASSYDTPPGMR